MMVGPGRVQHPKNPPDRPPPISSRVKTFHKGILQAQMVRLFSGSTGSFTGHRRTNEENKRLVSPGFSRDQPAFHLLWSLMVLVFLGYENQLHKGKVKDHQNPPAEVPREQAINEIHSCAQP